MARRGPAPEMVSYEEAVQIVTGAVRPLATETVALARARNRYLARPLKARFALPRFEQSVMDGFAVRAADLVGASSASPATLAVGGDMPAGPGPRLVLRPGQTVKVFTGGRLPRGADAVVVKEHVTLAGDVARFSAAPARGAHIRRVGEELRRGDEVLAAGTRITPPVVGLLATLGLTEVRVVRRPRVTVIVTGNEIVPAGGRLTVGCVHDANGPALLAALQSLGAAPARLRRVRDDVRALARSLTAALAASDLVVTVGGASVGDHDHVAAARSMLGVRELFQRVAVKPGKPNIFGLSRGGVPVFGLPGNPVSALVSFHQLVKPLLGVLMGAGAGTGRWVPLALREPVVKKPGRTHWLRGRLVVAESGLTADLATAQGSHMLSGLAAADILAELPAAADRVACDEVLRAWLIDWDRS